MLKRGWFGGGLWKPKNVHSLEHLRYLYTVLSKNQVVQDSNRSLLVEILRSIAEILIWGDQNDSSVFDFFLEKNMLSFFLKIMKQRCGSYVCVQLLQTLNILFENIRNETSLYYLLSNNHVNSIIVHKFDFSDEEVMAYYISFLKTLSLKLNSHTISFFYNVHTNDFPLYTEAIKFFNHPESMVRIAVRTLTLNVYRVEDESMLRFIRDRTAAPYFSNLVWFIGNHILELDVCVRHDIDHSSKSRLADLVAEHLDHLHYLNDILKLNITELNCVLADHLLNRLLVPLLVYSLNHHQNQDERPRVSRVVALFLLAQVFLIFSYSPLMQILAKIILHGDNSLFADNSSAVEGPLRLRPGFVAPEETLEKSLQSHSQSESNFGSQEFGSESSFSSQREEGISWRNRPAAPLSPTHTEEASSEDDSQNASEALPRSPLPPSSSSCDISDLEATHVNITDEEKEKLLFIEISVCTPVNTANEVALSSKPFLQSVLEALNCTENDYSSLFSLCLLYAMGHNTGVNRDLLSSLGTRENGVPRVHYNSQLVELILRIISQSAHYNSKIRVVTLEMALNVLRHLIGLTDPPLAASGTSGSSLRSVTTSGSESSGGCLRDQHLAALEGAKEEATLLLRNFYKGEEIFLDMFEDEWRELHRRPLNVEFLLQDESILLPPAGTPLTGIDFDKRLPCGEVERARRSMRVFFLIRELCLKIREERDPHLPLTNPAACVQVSDVLDLNNSDLIACVVITRDNQRARRFLVIDVIQLILVEPDQRKMGWGVAKFVGFLQDLEVSGDKDDSRVLHITIHRPSASSLVHGRPATPLLAAKFIFDDHIRCMAAKQRLSKGRVKARQKKLHQIARLLELPSHLQPCPSPPAHALSTMRQEAQKRGGSRCGEFRSRSGFHRGKFTPMSRGPGVAFKKEGSSANAPEDTLPSPGGAEGGSDSTPPRRGSSRSGSRSNSRPRPRSEEIPLENLSSSVGGTNEVGGKKTDYSPDKEPVTTSPEALVISKSANTQTINLVLSPVSVCSVPEQVPFQNSSPQTVTGVGTVPPFTLFIPPGTVIPVPLAASKDTEVSPNSAVFVEDVVSELSSGVPVQIFEAEEESVESHEETSFSSKLSCPKSSSFDFFEDQSATKVNADDENETKHERLNPEAGRKISDRVGNGNVCSSPELQCASSCHSLGDADSDVTGLTDLPLSHDDTGYLALNEFSPLRKVKPKGKVEII